MTGQTYLKNSTCNDVKLYRHTGIVDAQLLGKNPKEKVGSFSITFPFSLFPVFLSFSCTCNNLLFLEQ